MTVMFSVCTHGSDISRLVIVFMMTYMSAMKAWLKSERRFLDFINPDTCNKVYEIEDEVAYEETDNDNESLKSHAIR